MFRRLLRRLGYEIVYVHKLGVYEDRYDSADWNCQRPIHKDMSVAPPSAKMRIRRIA